MTKFLTQCSIIAALFLVSCSSEKRQAAASVSSGLVVPVSLSVCCQPFLQIGRGAAPLWVEARISNFATDEALNLARFENLKPRLVALGDEKVSVGFKLTKAWPEEISASEIATAIWMIEGELAPGSYRVLFDSPELENQSAVRRVKIETCRIEVKGETANSDAIAYLKRSYLLETEGAEAVVEELAALAESQPQNIGLQLELADAYHGLNRPKDELGVLIQSAHQMSGAKPGEPVPIEKLPCWMPGRIQDVIAAATAAIEE